MTLSADEITAAGLHFDIADAVATVTLSRPEVRNAQTPAMWHALAAIGEQLPDTTRVVVVRGAGQSFSAGLDRAMLDPATGDVAQLLQLDDEAISKAVDGYQQGFTWLRDPRFISIAAVQGHAIGAGFQLALSCDLRVVAEDAQFSMKEPALGLVPDLTGTKPLVEAVGYQTSAGDLRDHPDGRGRGGGVHRAGADRRTGRPAGGDGGRPRPGAHRDTSRVRWRRPRHCSSRRSSRTSRPSGGSSGRRRCAGSVSSPP